MSSKTSTLVWHCTGYSKYESIKRSCELRAKKVPWYSGRKPLIWFTASSQVDEVVNAKLQGYDQLRPLVRIGTAVTRAMLPFEAACKAAEFTRDSYRRAVQSAHDHGAKTNDWYAVVSDRLRVHNFVVEFLDRERDIWVSTRPDLIDFPQGLDEIGKARWAARLGLMCEHGFLGCALAGGLGYSLQEYAQGYVAGDNAYRDWVAVLDPKPDGHFNRSSMFRLGFLDRVAHLVGSLLPDQPVPADDSYTG